MTTIVRYRPASHKLRALSSAAATFWRASPAATPPADIQGTEINEWPETIRNCRRHGQPFAEHHGVGAPLFAYALAAFDTGEPMGLDCNRRFRLQHFGRHASIANADPTLPLIKAPEACLQASSMPSKLRGQLSGQAPLPTRSRSISMSVTGKSLVRRCLRAHWGKARPSSIGSPYGHGGRRPQSQWVLRCPAGRRRDPAGIPVRSPAARCGWQPRRKKRWG